MIKFLSGYGKLALEEVTGNVRAYIIDELYKMVPPAMANYYVPGFIKPSRSTRADKMISIDAFVHWMHTKGSQMPYTVIKHQVMDAIREHPENFDLPYSLSKDERYGEGGFCSANAGYFNDLMEKIDSASLKILNTIAGEDPNYRPRDNIYGGFVTSPDDISLTISFMETLIKEVVPKESDA